MPSAAQAWPNPYEDLRVEECFGLLAVKDLGRVAFEHSGPVVLPVHYVLDRGSIIIATSPYGYLGRHLRRREAAFQADAIDERTGAGWTILVRGSADALPGHELRHLERRPRTWGEGTHSLYLGIAPRLVTGRRYLCSTEV